jgi:hypothetical protein
VTSIAVGLLVAAAAWFVARPLVAGAGRTRWSRTGRRTFVVGVLVAAAVCAGVAMTRAVDRRPNGAGVAAGAAPVSAPVPAIPTEPPPSAQQAPDQPTDEELAAVGSALARVRDHPRDVAAHLDLARAYAGADQAQLSTVEYLAVLRLDRANPEANTALALVALAAGRPAEGKKLVDVVLAAHPRYPDALYTRGLIYLMGLRRAAPGIRDLRAYLAVAPYGSHRPAVQTLLAMVSDGRTP